ncbi:hypothetical protein L209DRAFT_437106 [Thermothelomyces heterothallicus CBS 203.75]
MSVCVIGRARQWPFFSEVLASRQPRWLSVSPAAEENVDGASVMNCSHFLARLFDCRRGMEIGVCMYGRTLIRTYIQFHSQVRGKAGHGRLVPTDDLGSRVPTLNGGSVVEGTDESSVVVVGPTNGVLHCRLNDLRFGAESDVRINVAMPQADAAWLVSNETVPGDAANGRNPV